MTGYGYVRAVIKGCIPVTSPLRCEIQHVIDRGEEIDAPLFDIRAHPRMRAVEVSHLSGRIASKHRNSRILASVAILTTQVVFEFILARAEQAQVIPATPPRMGT